MCSNLNYNFLSKDMFGCLKEIYQIGLQIRVCTRTLFFLFLNQTYGVGTQKNRLDETVLLSTQNICLN